MVLRVNTKEYVFGKNIDMIRQLKLYQILPPQVVDNLYCGKENLRRVI